MDGILRLKYGALESGDRFGTEHVSQHFRPLRSEGRPDVDGNVSADTNRQEKEKNDG